MTTNNVHCRQRVNSSFALSRKANLLGGAKKISYVLKLLLLLPLLLLITVSQSAQADTICFNTSTTASTGSLTDSGGAGSNYSNNEDCEFLIQPSEGGDITFSFTAFNYENNFDFVRIYDGTTTASTLLGSFTGTNSPSDLTATSGAMLIVHDTDFSVTRSGFSADWSTAPASSCPSQTIADNFPGVSYSQNSGSVNWASNWIEIGESNGTSSGIARVRSDNCSGGNCLRIGEVGTASSWSDIGVYREADLSSVSAATLTFNYFTGRASGTETVSVDISSNGGASWTTLQSYTVSGTSFSATSQSFDISAFVAANTQIRFLSNGNGRIGIYIDDIQISYDPICTTFSPVAEWRMDEAFWAGNSDEVVDTIGSLSGAAIDDAQTDVGQVCNAGSFDGDNDYVLISEIDNLLSGTASLSFWINTTQIGNNTNWLAPGVTGIEQEGGSDDVFWGWIDASGHISVGTGDLNQAISTTAINDGDWHHIVLTRDASSGETQVFVNGTLEANNNSGGGIIGNGFSSLGRIEDTGGTPNYFSGRLDEVLIFDNVIDPDNVSAVYINQLAGDNWDGTSRICAVFGPDHIEVVVDGSASTCVAETVTIRACADALCSSLFTSYSNAVALSTSTSHGDWSINNANGTLTPNPDNDDNGIVSYQFLSSDGGSVTLDLSNTHADDLTITAVDTALTLSDTSTNVAFRDNAFVITDADNELLSSSGGAANNIIVAGRDHAYNATVWRRDPGTGDCGIASNYVNSVPLKMWINRDAALDPGGNGPMVDTVTLPDSQPGLTNVDLNFVAGEADFIVQSSDIGKYSFSLLDDSREFATGVDISGTSSTAVVRPFALGFESIITTASNNNPGGDEVGGAGFVAAGELFHTRIGAYQYQAADDSNNDGVPNVNANITDNVLTISFSEVVDIALRPVSTTPLGGVEGALAGTTMITSVAGLATTDGVGVADGLTYSEVGSIRLRAIHNNFFGEADIDLQTDSGKVGRFYPDFFEVTSSSLTPACSVFTYMGQDFGLGYIVEAKSVDGNLVANYDNTELGYAGTASFNILAEDSNDGVNRQSRVSDTAVGVAPTWDDGRYEFSTLAIQFSRAVSPDGPFLALQLSASVSSEQDSRNFGLLNTRPDSNSNCVTDTNCSAVELATLTDIRYGRIFIENAFGPGSRALPVPAYAEYFNGTQFIFNTLDSCTILSNSLFDLHGASAPAAGILTGAVVGSSTTNLERPLNSLVAGELGLVFSAPNSQGEVTISLDLSTLPFLQFDWNNDGSQDNPPTATATFGTYRGNDRIIYRREISP